MSRGIMLFSTPMVRGIRAGNKTHTRRVVKPQPQPNGGKGLHPVAPYQNPYGKWAWVLAATGHGSGGDLFSCPYGQTGELIAVRETFYAWGRWETRHSKKKGRDEWHFIDMTLECGKQYAYAADNIPVPTASKRNGGVTPAWWKRPAIFMPLIASRIMLEITAVRIERLNDISEADCIAEGCAGGHGAIPGYAYHASPVEHYRWLWESLNGAGSWDANPWVWVVEFKVLKGGAA